MKNIQDILSQILNVFGTIRFVDVLDIALVALLIYEVIVLANKTRAAQLVKGLALLFIASLIVTNMQMRVISGVLSSIVEYSVLALVVIFQPEIRRILEQIGHTHIFSLDMLKPKTASEEHRLQISKTIAVVCDAAQQMSVSRTGALIVFERKSNLGEILTTGTPINADTTVELLQTIFYEGTLLHDGAVVIRDGKVAAAGCVLPLSDNLEISKEMGTRHRAALGMSENSDAVVVVVSEESGIVSLAKNGVLIRRLDRAGLYKILTTDLLPMLESGEKENKKHKKGKAAAKAADGAADPEKKGDE